MFLDVPPFFLCSLQTTDCVPLRGRSLPGITPSPPSTLVCARPHSCEYKYETGGLDRTAVLFPITMEQEDACRDSTGTVGLGRCNRVTDLCLVMSVNSNLAKKGKQAGDEKGTK